MSRLTQISGAHFRFFGDHLRDKRSWHWAAWFYRAYVALNPRDAALQVQLGNCSKEAGSLANAARAYECALALNPDDTETRAELQILRGALSTPEYHADTALKVDELTSKAAERVISELSQEVCPPKFGFVLLNESASGTTLMSKKNRQLQLETQLQRLIAEISRY